MVLTSNQVWFELCRRDMKIWLDITTNLFAGLDRACVLPAIKGDAPVIRLGNIRPGGHDAKHVCNLMYTVLRVHEGGGAYHKGEELTTKGRSLPQRGGAYHKGEGLTTCSLQWCGSSRDSKCGLVQREELTWIPW